MSEYKRLTNNNLEEYDPEYDFCIGCKHFGEPNGCNRPNGTCGNYERFIETYNRLAELEDKITDGTLVELPCKLGTKLYFLVLHMFDGYFEIFETDLWVYVSRYKDEFGGVDFSIEINDVDFDCETWVIAHYYSSKAEAEARLKELNNSYKETGEF